jgi:hypothetical protein
MTDTKSIIVCGGRDFKDFDRVQKALNAVLRKHPNLRVIEGGARGADSLAKLWCGHNGVECLTVKADWNGNGKRAGPIRNQEMLDMGPIGVVAFPGGRGTADMVGGQKRRAFPSCMAELLFCLQINSATKHQL